VRAERGRSGGFFGASKDTSRRVGSPIPRPLSDRQVTSGAGGRLHLHHRAQAKRRRRDRAGRRAGDEHLRAAVGCFRPVSWGTCSGAIAASQAPAGGRSVALERTRPPASTRRLGVEDGIRAILFRRAGRLRATVLRGRTVPRRGRRLLSAGISFDTLAPVQAVVGGWWGGGPLKWVDDTIGQLVRRRWMSRAARR